MRPEPPSTFALILAVPLMAGFFGAGIAGVFLLLNRRLGARSLWLWPPIVLVLVSSLVATRPGALADPPSIFASVLTPVLFALLFGLAPAWRVWSVLAKEPSAPFAKIYANTVVAMAIGTAVLGLLIYAGFRWIPVA